MLAGLWAGRAASAFCAVVLLAALQDVPRELAEAASIDGARRGGVFRHVTLPAIAPVLGVPAAVADRPGDPAVRPRLRLDRAAGRATSTVVVVYYIYRSIRETRRTGRARPRRYAVARRARASLTAPRAAGCRRRASAGGRSREPPAAPFDPVHLVLAPVCALLALPLRVDAAQLVHEQRADQPLPADDHPRLAAPRRLPLPVRERGCRHVVRRTRRS